MTNCTVNLSGDSANGLSIPLPAASNVLQDERMSAALNNNRRNEFDEVAKFLKTQNCVLVSGEPGVGKRELALYLAREWARPRGFLPYEFQVDALVDGDSIAARLHGSIFRALYPRNRPKEELAVSMDLSGYRYFLVLNGCAKFLTGTARNDFWDLIGLLSFNKDHKIIVTSDVIPDNKPESVPYLKIDRFSDELSSLLISAYCKAPLEVEKVDFILHRALGNPWLLKALMVEVIKEDSLDDAFIRSDKFSGNLRFCDESEKVLLIISSCFAPGTIVNANMLQEVLRFDSKRNVNKKLINLMLQKLTDLFLLEEEKEPKEEEKEPKEKEPKEKKEAPKEKEEPKEKKFRLHPCLRASLHGNADHYKEAIYWTKLLHRGAFEKLVFIAKKSWAKDGLVDALADFEAGKDVLSQMFYAVCGFENVEDEDLLELILESFKEAEWLVYDTFMFLEYCFPYDKVFKFSKRLLDVVSIEGVGDKDSCKMTLINTRLICLSYCSELKRRNRDKNNFKFIQKAKDLVYQVGDKPFGEDHPCAPSAVAYFFYCRSRSLAQSSGKNEKLRKQCLESFSNAVIKLDQWKALSGPEGRNKERQMLEYRMCQALEVSKKPPKDGTCEDCDGLEDQPPTCECHKRSWMRIFKELKELCENFNRVLGVHEQTCTAYKRVGDFCMKMEYYDAAIFHLNDARRLLDEVRKDSMPWPQTAMILNHLGICLAYAQEKDPDKKAKDWLLALHYLHQSLILSKNQLVHSWYMKELENATKIFLFVESSNVKFQCGESESIKEKCRDLVRQYASEGLDLCQDSSKCDEATRKSYEPKFRLWLEQVSTQVDAYES